MYPEALRYQKTEVEIFRVDVASWLSIVSGSRNIIFLLKMTSLVGRYQLVFFPGRGGLKMLPLGRS